MARGRGEDFLSHCATTVERALVAAGIEGRHATTAAIEVMSAMRQNFGGCELYVPKGRSDVSEDAAEAFAQWSTGKAIGEIAADRGITVRWAYTLISKERARLKGLRMTRTSGAKNG